MNYRLTFSFAFPVLPRKVYGSITSNDFLSLVQEISMREKSC